MSEKLFKTDDDLKAAIALYFEQNPEKPTITGLALSLGFCSRQSLYDYEKNGDHSYTVKTARTRIEQAYEERLHGSSPTGAIFALKNFGWEDKSTNVLEGGDKPIEITGIDVCFVKGQG